MSSWSFLKYSWVRMLGFQILFDSNLLCYLMFLRTSFLPSSLSPFLPPFLPSLTSIYAWLWSSYLHLLCSRMTGTHQPFPAYWLRLDLVNFLSGLPWTNVLPISASKVARITSMSHCVQSPLSLFDFYLFIYIFGVLGFEFRVLNFLGKCCTIWAMPKLFYF
jgi:hypothetical protein